MMIGGAESGPAGQTMELERNRRRKASGHRSGQGWAWSGFDELRNMSPYLGV